MIAAYENRVDEEARFVYALDKLLALLMIIEDGGGFWKANGITFEQHLAKADEVLAKVAAHPAVEAWYMEALAHIEENQDDFFG